MKAIVQDTYGKADVLGLHMSPQTGSAVQTATGGTR